MYLAVPDPRGLRLHPVVPVDRARPGERDRRRARAPRPPHGRRARRRRRDDGAARARDRRPPARCRSLFVIYDDAAYGAEVHHFRPMGHPVETVQFPDADFAAIARGAGAEGVDVRTLDDLDPSPTWLAAARRARCSSTPRSTPTSCAEWLRGGLPRRLTTTTEEEPMSIHASAPPPHCSPPWPTAPCRSSTSRSRCSEKTPVLKLPEPFANTPGLDAPRDQPLRRPRAGVGVELAGDRRARRDALRRADPLDHGQGRRGRRERAARAARRPRGRDRQVRRGARPTPTTCSRSTTSRAFEAEHGALPDGGWLLLRTGWDARAHDEEAFLNAGDGMPRTPGADAECARWLAQETRHRRHRRRDGRDRRGRRGRVRPAVPRPPATCSAPASTASRSSRTSRELPPTGAVLVVAPLKLVGGTGSPARVLALVGAG